MVIKLLILGKFQHRQFYFILFHKYFYILDILLHSYDVSFTTKNKGKNVGYKLIFQTFKTTNSNRRRIKSLTNMKVQH